MVLNPGPGSDVRPSAEACSGVHSRLPDAGRGFRDLSDTLRRTLEGFGPQSSAPSGQTRGTGAPYRRRIKPGSILVREWNGHLQRVTALEEGFAWEAKTYRNLSMVARAITGGHWNGPRFFGLTGSRAMVGAAALIASTKQAQTPRVDKGTRAALEATTGRTIVVCNPLEGGVKLTEARRHVARPPSRERRSMPRGRASRPRPRSVSA